MPSKLKDNPRSLKEFMRAKRLADCRVCALPEEVLAQLRTANSKRIPTADRLVWLAKEIGIPITAEEMSRHVKGGHDVR